MSSTPTTTPSSSKALITGPSSGDVPQYSLNRQVVLEEDEYTSALSKIIARDFFPSLAHLDATNSYLSALDSQDQDRIEQTVKRLVDLKATPVARSSWGQDTPYAQGPSDTPLRTPRREDGSSSSKKLRIDTYLSLDAFQAKYTSEDNASFTDILDEENKKRREKYWWAWDAERKVNESKVKEIEGRDRLLLTNSVAPSTIQRQIEGKEPSGAEEDGGDVKSSSGTLIIRANGNQSGDEPNKPVDVMAPRKDMRSASVPGWRFKARNSLMFTPDADASPYHPPSSVPPSTGNEPPKEVRHANTRLPEQSEEVPSSSVPPSPTRSRVAAAIMGTPYHKDGGETPKVQGFGLAMKELMTWGTLLGTPRVIQNGDDLDPSTFIPSPFKVPEPSKRDELGRRLGVQASKSLREKATLLSAPSSTPRKRKAAGDMPPPAFTPRRVAQTDMLSPAARNLLGRTKSGVGLGLDATTARSDPSSSHPQPQGKELDLRKVGWSPMNTPVTSNTRRR
ncbi:nuclear protein DGCR14 [Cantharellus anzutake]|uniref:nuclear protein DGCR14 n=1 Tax=Cantharellus anzutake TaxID=1750568 RepID=UPI0019047CB5|nr:nuclear protein DGCR14 [Cantharellus anzutake]KAF8337942.1 nuclear protein DGCR14 [Cantharellus anzutake]